MKSFKALLGWLIQKTVLGCNSLIREYNKTRFASFGAGSWFDDNCVFTYKTVHIGEKVTIGPKCLIRSAHGTIHIGNHVMIGPGVHIHGGNHIINQKGCYLDEVQKGNNTDGELIIEDDVWIGSYSIILKGSQIGRGAIIGAGSVVRHQVPPYSMVSGNPCKVVGFRLTPDEIVEHEKNLYPEKERLPLEVLEKNYEKYFLKRLKEIKEFSKL